MASRVPASRSSYWSPSRGGACRTPPARGTGDSVGGVPRTQNLTCRVFPVGGPQEATVSELERGDERGFSLKRKSPVSREICGEVVEFWKKEELKRRNVAASCSPNPGDIPISANGSGNLGPLSHTVDSCRGVSLSVSSLESLCSPPSCRPLSALTSNCNNLS